MQEQKAEEVRALELFNGIGGFHYALRGVPNGAFDLNHVANDVYEHNFGFRPESKNLESVEAKVFDSYRADLWMLSPPCQPFSRNGNRKDVEDPRNRSLLHIIAILPALTTPPRYIILENVQGFESSRTRDLLASTLVENAYTFQEFLLSPDQIGIPNRRLRYFLLAKRLPYTFQSTQFHGRVCHELPFAPPPPDRTCVLSSYLENSPDMSILAVPERILRRSGQLFDVVTHESSCCNCFTKNYTRAVEGAGSVIRTQCQQETDLLLWGLRYFSPREIARLLGFPESFRFPPETSLAQQYRALGNSLNVALVGFLLRYLLSNE